MLSVNSLPLVFSFLHYWHLSLFFIISFVDFSFSWKAELQRKTKYFHLLVYFRVAAPTQSWSRLKPRSSELWVSHLSERVEGFPALGPSAAAFPGSLSGSEVRRGVARTQAALIWDACVANIILTCCATTLAPIFSCNMTRNINTASRSAWINYTLLFFSKCPIPPCLHVGVRRVLLPAVTLRSREVLNKMAD